MCQCLGTEAGGRLPRALREFAGADWRSLIQESDRHGVTPLLYFCVKASGDSHVPPAIIETLRNAYLHSAAANARRYRQLSTILAALKDELIPVIVLKGAHLAEVVYGGMVGLRTMGDVDLLLRREDLQRSRERLLEIGCCQSGEGALNLDIHWNIGDVDLFGNRGLAVGQFNIDVDGIWERARPAVIGGVTALVLCPEDLLTHLCIHLSYDHLFLDAGLRSLCDLRQTIRHYDSQIEWGGVQRRSEKWGMRNGVFLSLLLAKTLLGADVPDQVVESMKPDEWDAEARDWALSQVFDGGHCSLSPFFWHMLSPAPFREKVRHFLRLVFPPPLEFKSRRFPVPLRAPKSLFHQAVRLKAKSWRHIRALGRMVLRDKEMAAIVEREKRNVAMRKWLSGAPRSASLDSRGEKNRRRLGRGVDKERLHVAR